METVATGIGSIVRSRVRDALLHLTRDEPQILQRETIANEAAVDPSHVDRVMQELTEGGPFVVRRVQPDEAVWRVK